jgi:2-oxoglutarate dehydrogenase E1 component
MVEKSPRKTEVLHVDGSSLAFVEGLYADYLRDPASVPRDWRRWFDELSREAPEGREARLRPSFRPRSIFNPPAKAGPNGVAARRAALSGADLTGADAERLQIRVDQLVRSYRARGHRMAQIDPLGLERPRPPELDPAFYGLGGAEMNAAASIDARQGPVSMRVREILTKLRATYCRSIGVQFMHIDDVEERRWLQYRMEESENRRDLGRDQKLRILRRLTDAVVFEEFIQRTFLGAKSFSLEGAESLIPLLDLAIEKAGDDGVEEIVLGMAHRGRLNVLASVMGKSAREIFREFADVDPEQQVGRGDVKYHLGHSGDWTTASGRKVHLSLCFNPSHLEFVDPVALGRVRAKQDRAGDGERRRGMVLLIHGDAAFSGEGIVQESLNLSELAAYRVGGALHVVVNNQIGFTTTAAELSSTIYATDVAKMLQIPIFHVNGEDPEAVAQVVDLAMDYRRTFRRDVVIDMFCYRRRGHNEADEPAFTQPLLYRAIENRPPVRESYLDHLLAHGGVTREEADEIALERRRHLEAELSASQSEVWEPRSEWLRGAWSGYLGGPESEAGEVDTGVERDRLASLLERLTRLPRSFRPHPKIAKWLEGRRRMASGERPLDWAAAEALAFASLAVQGIRVRLTGQDTERGTFSQRHAVLHDVEDGRRYEPLAHLAPDQAPVEIRNSPLCEAGVLGFEYGYSLDCPDGLVLWEAQFGDFGNAAQVVIDQFLLSAERKWRRLSGLVLLLPHGLEGQGPEHSSARLERFLSLAAEDNVQVVQPTTPAQYFHCLRRQALRRWRKPLVVLTPKSLLRHPEAISTLEECARGAFRRVLPDPLEPPRESLSRVILCSGKVAYELEAERRKLGRKDVAILRLEQLYPLRDEALHKALEFCRDGTPVFWVQEEPENMGAWHALRVRFGDRLLGRLPFACVARPTSASPATGSTSRHRLEQNRLLHQAFAPE